MTAHAVERPFLGTNGYDVDGSVLASAVLLDDLDGDVLLDAPAGVPPTTHADALQDLLQNSLSALLFTMRETQHEASEERTWPAENGPTHHARNERRHARLVVVRALVSLLGNFLGLAECSRTGSVAVLLQPAVAALGTAILSDGGAGWRRDDESEPVPKTSPLIIMPGAAISLPDSGGEEVEEAVNYVDEDDWAPGYYIGADASSYAPDWESEDGGSEDVVDLTDNRQPSLGAPRTDSDTDSELRAKAVEGLILIAKAVKRCAGRAARESDKENILAEILDVLRVARRGGSEDSTLVELELKNLTEVLML